MLVSPDWSTLMTQTLESLNGAEEELRMLHMNPLRATQARTYIWRAQGLLLQLDEWCKMGVKDEA